LMLSTIFDRSAMYFSMVVVRYGLQLIRCLSKCAEELPE
jgi:hypothetical protein